MSEKQPIVHVHIEKTGGSAIKNFYTRKFGEKHVLFYSPAEDGLYRASDESHSGVAHPTLHLLRNALVRSNTGEKIYKLLKKYHSEPAIKILGSIPPDTDIIIGHFTADKWNLPEAKLVGVFREPFSRVKSSYLYDKLVTYPAGTAPSWFTPDMPFEEYALTEFMTEFQSKRLGSKDITDFHHVGTTSSLRQFCDIFDPLQQVPLLKVNQSPKHTVIYPATLEEKFRQQNAEDYALYSYADNSIQQKKPESTSIAFISNT